MAGNKDQQHGGKTGQQDMKRDESGHRSGEAGRGGGQHQGGQRDDNGKGGMQDNHKNQQPKK